MATTTPVHQTSSPGRRILVTGGAGFIGSHLVERLLEKDDAVTVIDDLSTGSLDNLKAVSQSSRLRVVQSRISDCAELRQIVRESDSIFHLAAAVGVDLVVRSPIHVLETNLHETEVLLELAADTSVPVLLASTSEVYGKSSRTEFDEEDDLLIGPPHQSRWSYACSKLMDEFLALAYAGQKSLPVIITRLFNTVGPRQTGRYGMVLPRFIAAARSGQPLKVFGDGQQSRCFCFVADTVEALMRLEQSTAARSQVFNVGGTEEVTILELAKRVLQVTGSPSKIEFVPYSEAYAPGFDDMRRRKPCVARLQSVTDFRPQIPLDEIIRRTAAAA